MGFFSKIIPALVEAGVVKAVKPVNNSTPAVVPPVDNNTPAAEQLRALTPAPTTMMPATEMLAMREGVTVDQEPRQYAYQQPQQLPVRQVPSFQPQAPALQGDFMDLIRRYADKSMMPALPRFEVSANQPQQFAAGGSVMGQRGYSEMEASPKRVGFKGWTVPTKQVAVKGVMYNPTTGQYFEVDSSTPYQHVPEGWKFTMTPGSISTAGEASTPSEMAKLPEQYQQKAMNSIAENQQMMLDFLKKNRMGV